MLRIVGILILNAIVKVTVHRIAEGCRNVRVGLLVEPRVQSVNLHLEAYAAVLRVEAEPEGVPYGLDAGSRRAKHHRAGAFLCVLGVGKIAVHAVGAVYREFYQIAVDFVAAQLGNILFRIVQRILFDLFDILLPERDEVRGLFNYGFYPVHSESELDVMAVACPVHYGLEPEVPETGSFLCPDIESCPSAAKLKFALAVSLEHIVCNLVFHFGIARNAVLVELDFYLRPLGALI